MAVPWVHQLAFDLEFQHAQRRERVVHGPGIIAHREGSELAFRGGLPLTPREREHASVVTVALRQGNVAREQLHRAVLPPAKSGHHAGIAKRVLDADLEDRHGATRPHVTRSVRVTVAGTRKTLRPRDSVAARPRT